VFLLFSFFFLNFLFSLLFLFFFLYFRIFFVLIFLNFLNLLFFLFFLLLLFFLFSYFSIYFRDFKVFRNSSYLFSQLTFVCSIHYFNVELLNFLPSHPGFSPSSLPNVYSTISKNFNMEFVEFNHFEND